MYVILAASIVYDKISSYKLQRAAFIYRFETKNCTETLNCFATLKLTKTYQRSYLLSYGVDGFDTGGSVIHWPSWPPKCNPLSQSLTHI
jgi:hypothetical protein